MTGAGGAAGQVAVSQDSDRRHQVHEHACSAGPSKWFDQNEAWSQLDLSPLHRSSDLVQPTYARLDHSLYGRAAKQVVKIGIRDVSKNANWSTSRIRGSHRHILTHDLLATQFDEHS